MKRTLVVCALLLSACWGFSSRENEAIGQVKKVVRKTPLVCSEWSAVDISLGVLRNGVGSMSTEDVWYTVNDQKDLDVLKSAAANGHLVKFKFDVARFCWCRECDLLTSVEEIK